MTGLSCRACGGPLAITLDEPCRACGTAPELDPEVRRRLVDHAARVAAAWQELRSVIGYRLIIAQAQGAGCLRAIGLVIVVAVPFALLGLAGGALMLFPLTAPMGFCALLGAGLGVLPAQIAAVVQLSVLRRTRAALGAEAELASLEPPADTACPSCGGHARVLGAGPWPCPYCETPLVPPPEATIDVEARLASLATRHKELADHLAGRRLAPAPWPNGWTWDYGVVTGSVAETPVWGGEDVHEGSAVLLYRVDAPGPLAWIVHRDDEPRFRARALHAGVPWPPGDGVDLGGGWLGFGDALERPRHLQRGEALIRDAAGLHWWRFDTVRNTTFAGLRHHSGRVAAMLASASP